MIAERPGENSNAPVTSGAYRLWAQRTQHAWGLLEWIRHSSRTYKIDKLLIESKASGISAAQDLRARHGREGYSIQLVTPTGDKVARALSVQPILSQGLVYAPNRDFAELLITQAAVFPKGKRDDAVDSMTQALRYLRDVGLAQNDQETRDAEQEAVTHDSRRYTRKALYPV